MEYKSIYKEANNNSNYIIELLKILNQIKIFHLQTTIYEEHIALSNYYDKMSDLIDSFIEKRFGIEGRENIFGTINVFDYGKNKVKPYVNECLIYLKKLRTEINGYTDLENILDEMLAETNQLKYLLTLI